MMFAILGNETSIKTPVAKMPKWMRVISKGELFEPDTSLPVAKQSLTQKLCVAGSAFKSFFKDHAKIYRVV
jgi:hypothetical protein